MLLGRDVAVVLVPESEIYRQANAAKIADMVKTAATCFRYMLFEINNVLHGKNSSDKFSVYVV